MKKPRARKLSLTRDTLHVMGGTISSPEDSCVQSCYLQSCGGSCGISTGVKQLCDQLEAQAAG